MKIKLNVKKSAYENADEYYKRAKKYREKLKRTREAYAQTRKQLEWMEIESKKPPKKKLEKKRWYQKFRYFFIDDFLVVGGKDADTNEILIKKHTEKKDIVFHADITGAPFFVIKTEGREVSDRLLRTVATLSVCYSKAWSHGLGAVDTYWVKPEQVSKKPPAGEYLPKGAFMIYGKKNYFKNVRLQLALCVVDGKLIVGDEESVKGKGKYVVLLPGDIKSRELAEKIKKKIKISAEEIQRVVPGGKGRIK